jgi:predicted Zn finger-like uncharacterized protein
MKFLCDNCKAKYQIADEKVAGKTVRMKCRKCGHQIEVRAAVTEESTGGSVPPPPPAPRIGAPLATSLSAAKPRPSQFPVAASVAPQSALAGAFSRNVHDAPSSLSNGPKSATIELSVTDEWYVAINGVPVGPVRISELRRKAAAGAVTEESLCWQEGLEEWRPIKSIPDLAALVREAALGNRPSLSNPPEPAPALRGSTPSVPRQPAAQRISNPPPRPTAPSSPPFAPAPPLAAAPARSNVVPLRPAASSGIEEVGLGLGGGAAAAFAPVAPPVATPQPSFPPQALPPPTIDPFAVPPPAPVPFRDSVHPPPQPSFYPAPPGYEQSTKKAGIPLWFWPILVLALGFGGTVAFLVFRPQQAPVVIQMPATAQTPPPPQPTATTDTKDAPPPSSAEPTTTPTTEIKPTKGPVAARGPRPNTPAAAGDQKGLDLGSLSTSGGGPAVGPNPGAGAAGGGGLDQAAVERVVAGHRNGVKRTCWERGGDQKASGVNVTVTANVAPDGSVASTSSSGDDPVVAKCIETQVKSWRFPAPGAATTLNIPFKFVRQ